MARIRKVDGGKVRERREEAWWTQQELADAAGVTRTTVVEIESGRNHSPRRGTIKALARALGVEPNDLLEDRRDPLGLGYEGEDAPGLALGPRQ